MKEKEIIDKVIDALSEIKDATVISANDFTTERDENMILVGIEDTEEVNPTLPDFRHRLQVVIDTFITEDKEGDLFDDTYKKVMEILGKFVTHQDQLSLLFGEIPVVGFFMQGANFMLTDTSHRCSINYDIITSF